MGSKIVPHGWCLQTSPFSGNPGLEHHWGSYLGKCCARHLISIIFNLHRILKKQLLFSHGNYKSQRMRLVSDKASLPEEGNEVQLTLKWQSTLSLKDIIPQVPFIFPWDCTLPVAHSWCSSTHSFLALVLPARWPEDQRLDHLGLNPKAILR